MHAAGAAAWLLGQGGSHRARHSTGNPRAAEAQSGRHHCRQELCHPGQPCLNRQSALHRIFASYKIENTCRLRICIDSLCVWQPHTQSLLQHVSGIERSCGVHSELGTISASQCIIVICCGAAILCVFYLEQEAFVWRQEHIYLSRSCGCELSVGVHHQK